MQQNKIIIYQIFTRLFGNDNPHCIYNGSIEENKCGKLKDFNSKTFKEIKKLGATHIWYTGIIEHATQTDYQQYGIKSDHPAIVKGKAGSPYAIKDYYNIDPDLAIDVPNRMKEFEELVERTHYADLKVIIDFVPNHVARQYCSTSKPEGVTDLGESDNPCQPFHPNNNFYYLPDTHFKGLFDLLADTDIPYEEYPAKATGNDRFTPTPTLDDWYETIKLNYGVDYCNGCIPHFNPIPDTWLKMRDILLFWASKKVDGFRCDMAEMVPVEFWEWAIKEVKQHYPDLIFIAEIYNPCQYHNYIYKGGFDYLYDKVGLYDTIRNITCGYESACAITNCWQSLGDINTKMLYFMENHDEQRIASDYFAGNGMRGIPGMIVTACMNVNPVMIYFGQEFGEPGMDNEGFSGRDGRTTIFDYWSVPAIRHWRNKGKYDGELLSEESVQLYEFYKKLLTICQKEKAIYKGRFFDLMYANKNGWRFNEHKQYAFMRQFHNELLLIVVNFDSLPVDIAINIPSHAFDFLGIPPKENYLAKDLLTGEKETVCLLPYKATELKVESMQGKILKIKL